MKDDDVQSAAGTMKLLLENGAIWNDVDKDNETPGCVALRLGLTELYAIMVDAGVRAEILLGRLDEYEMLKDRTYGEEEEEEQKEFEGSEGDCESKNLQEQDADAESKRVEEAGTRPNARVEPNNEDYLRSSLTFHDGKLLDESRNGVMMAWETDIMKRSVELLVPKEGLRILNIGHGMGIIDKIFQETSPSAHHIIEVCTL